MSVFSSIPCAGTALRHLSLVLGVAALVAAPSANAQNPFSAAVTIDDSIVTHYELAQRELFLRTVRTPGDLAEQALDALVNERLQAAEAERLGVSATPEEIEAGVEEFAGRADMGPEQFIRALAEEGVAPETFRDFVASGISWRNVVQTRFAPRINISEADIQNAMALATDPSNAQLLLAEIIVPLVPQNAETLFDDMAGLSAQLNGDLDTFSEAARRFSAAATRENGGVTGWRPLSVVPPALLDSLITLPVGRTTPPISLGNAIAIFQMRGLRETGLPAPRVTSIDYVTMALPGGNGEDARAAASALRAENDVCDDLYETRPGAFERHERGLRDIPTDVALALSTLDPGEISFDVTRNQGATTLAVMLCARDYAADENAEDAVRRQLFAQQIDSYAAGLLAELRANATIDYAP